MNSTIERILTWLRAGYPQGVPQQDYVALFGILRRSLTDTEVASIAEAVRSGGAGDEETIRGHVEDVAHQSASDEDVRRVTEHLLAGGWPVDEEAARADGVQRLMPNANV